MKRDSVLISKDSGKVGSNLRFFSSYGLICTIKKSLNYVWLSPTKPHYNFLIENNCESNYLKNNSDYLENLK